MKKLFWSFLGLLFISGIALGAGSIFKEWGSTTQIMGSGGAYATIDGNSTQNQAETYTSVVDMTAGGAGYEGALVTINAYEGAANDGTGVSVYFYHEDPADDSGITSYGAPNISFELPTDKGDGGVTKTFLITDAPFWMIGISHINGGDAYSARVYYKPWQWQYD